jgi:hypothetical protein
LQQKGNNLRKENAMFNPFSHELHSRGRFIPTTHPGTTRSILSLHTARRKPLLVPIIISIITLVAIILGAVISFLIDLSNKVSGIPALETAAEAVLLCA